MDFILLDVFGTSEWRVQNTSHFTAAAKGDTPFCVATITSRYFQAPVTSEKAQAAGKLVQVYIGGKGQTLVHGEAKKVAAVAALPLSLPGCNWTHTSNHWHRSR